MKSHAVVIGGSMAGLLAARVLAPYFARVTIVERDRFPTGSEPRKGLPQARHVHVLLVQGQRCLEQLFPGLQDELGQAGAPLLDWIGDSRWFSYGGWAPRFQSGYMSHPCSRDLLEWCVRRRLSAYSNIELLEERQAVDCLVNSSATHVTGLRLRHRQPGGEIQDLPADLVVDASGRDSQTSRWLEALGYPPPQATLVNAFLGYATRVFQRPPDFDAWKSLLVRGTPPADKRGGVINAIEHDRWMVTLAGAGGDYPPTEETGFLEFARSLPVPTLYDAIKDAQPLTPISGYRKTENRWNHFEKLARWPENIIVLGDAVCAFNPVYGQGMTAAALGALALEKCLHDRRAEDDLDGLAKSFQQRLARVVAAPWLLATGDDYRYPETQGGRRNALIRWMHSYMDRVMLVANQDPQVFMTFFKVAQLCAPVSSLFTPRILAKAALLRDR